MPVSSRDNDHLSIPEKHLELSKAYLFAAKVVCKKQEKAPESETYEKRCACMFNARLSIELFLKAAILKKDSNIKLHHVIETLAEKYKQLYPAIKYEWEVPFTVEVLGVDDKEESDKIANEHLKEYPQDQIFRY